VLEIDSGQWRLRSSIVAYAKTLRTDEVDRASCAPRIPSKFCALQIATDNDNYRKERFSSLGGFKSTINGRTQIAVADVIGENEHDVGFRLLRVDRCAQRGGAHKGYDVLTWHSSRLASP
jgi:hypothetical protein